VKVREGSEGKGGNERRKDVKGGRKEVKGGRT
jgi:hypothetical protein